jgi:hypothetical protein
MADQYVPGPHSDECWCADCKLDRKLASQPVVEYAMNTTGMTADQVAEAQRRFQDEDRPLPWILGRVDTAPLDEVIGWATHPHIRHGGLMDEVVARLVRELKEAGVLR